MALHNKAIRIWLGMAEYCLQAALLLLMAIALRRFRLSYLFSFCTAVLYHFILDFWLWLAGYLPCDGIALRFAFYIAGLVLCYLGVATLFHTYIAPEAYELLVKGISTQYRKSIAVVKTVYDCLSCGVAIALSFAFFGYGHFEGVKLGTIACALVNGWVIGKIGSHLDGHFDFRDALKCRRLFD